MRRAPDALVHFVVRVAMYKDPVALVALAYGFVQHAAVSRPIDVRIINSDGSPSLSEIVVAVGAVASPFIAFIVAVYVTSRTLANERTQRALDRQNTWLEQLHDRQLATSADFAHAVFRALVVLDDMHPTTGETTDERLADSKRALEAARLAMARVQLLFRGTLRVTNAARTLVDLLNTAQKSLERRHSSEAPAERAKAQAEYASAIEAARLAHDEFLTEASAAIGEHPEAAASTGHPRGALES